VRALLTFMKHRLSIVNKTTTFIDGKQCVTPEAAAAAAGCSLPTLRRRVRAGLLRPIRAHGRTWFAVNDLAELQALARLRLSARSRQRGLKAPHELGVNRGATRAQ
jgi:hypothetical protein